MNGVRRFLGGGSSSTPATPEPAIPPALPSTAPLSISSKSSWPPGSPTSQSQPGSPPRDILQASVTPLLFRKDKARPLLPDGDTNGSQPSGAVNSPSRSRGSLPQSPVAGPSSPRPARVSQLSRKSVGQEWKRSSQMSTVRDDLLMSLLASEAIVDSTGYDILGAEEVEELKKEQQVLSSRMAAMNKKLTLETKIRDAAVSLSKVNASYKNVSKQTDEQLESANKKVDQTQKELWRVSERYNEVQRKLLEHRAGVLGQSVRKLEKQGTSTDETTTSGYSTPNRSSQMSPTTSSVTSVQTASSKGRFDGAHLFAGHAESIAPFSSRAFGRQPNGLTELEEKLQSATDTLEVATAKQAEMEQELSLLRSEKESLEASLGAELESARNAIMSLEQQVARMEEMEEELHALSEEQTSWEQQQGELEETRLRAEEQRQELEAKEQEIDAIQQELSSRQRQIKATQQEMEALRMKMEVLEARSGDAVEAEGALALEMAAHLAELQSRDKQLEEMKTMWEVDKAAWELERATLAGETREMSSNLERAMEAELSTRTQLDECLSSLDVLVEAHGIDATGVASASLLVSSVGQHLQTLQSQAQSKGQAEEEWAAHQTELETNLREIMTKYNATVEELQQTKNDRDEVKARTRDLEAQLQAGIVVAAAAAQAAAQPTVEYKGDVASLVAILQPVWSILPSAEARASKLGTRPLRTSSSSGRASPSTTRNGSSLAELDVRSLKSLYDPKGVAMTAHGGGMFTVDAFAERVRALIADDRLLIERLIRFAQAHDLLKKNAERAQKLAQDSNAALETYQKQVKTLEERNISLMTQQAEMQEELQWFQESVERLQVEKLEIETQAAAQADTCAQLTEANNKLSAKALIMAQEAASTTDSVRKQLETQLAEANSSLSKASEEVESMRQSQQIQQMALLEELNSVQTENTNLRAQLRAKK